MQQQFCNLDTLAWMYPTHGPNRQPTPSHMAPDISIRISLPDGHHKARPVHFGPFASREVAEETARELQTLEAARNAPADATLCIEVAHYYPLYTPKEQRIVHPDQIPNYLLVFSVKNTGKLKASATTK